MDASPHVSHAFTADAYCHPSPRSVPSGREAQPAELQFAADLAAYYSREKGATKSLVSFTSPRHVRRAPGGRLGMVAVAKEEVMVARPADAAAAAARAGEGSSSAW